MGEDSSAPTLQKPMAGGQRSWQSASSSTLLGEKERDTLRRADARARAPPPNAYATCGGSVRRLNLDWGETGSVNCHNRVAAELRGTASQIGVPAPIILPVTLNRLNSRVRGLGKKDAIGPVDDVLWGRPVGLGDLGILGFIAAVRPSLISRGPNGKS